MTLFSMEKHINFLMHPQYCYNIYLDMYRLNFRFVGWILTDFHFIIYGHSTCIITTSI